jgi:hypothetical protein
LYSNRLYHFENRQLPVGKVCPYAAHDEKVHQALSGHLTEAEWDIVL